MFRGNTYPGLPQSWKVLESPGIRKRSWKVLECPGISLIFAESPGKVLEFYTAPYMSFSNSRTFQGCGKCYIIFYIAVAYFSILICHFVLVTPCYITCWKNSVFLFFAYSGVSKSPGISKNVLEKSWKLECKSPGKSEKKSWKVLEFDIKFSVATLTLRMKKQMQILFHFLFDFPSLTSSTENAVNLILCFMYF